METNKQQLLWISEDAGLLSCMEHEAASGCLRTIRLYTLLATN